MIRHVLGFVVIQAALVAAIGFLWIAGIAQKPFQGSNAIVCLVILGIGALGLLALLCQSWKHSLWIAKHVVRVGLLGTVIGLIIAFSAAKAGGSGDPEATRLMISTVIAGMYVSLYATLMGIAVNLWLKANLWLLGGVDG